MPYAASMSDSATPNAPVVRHAARAVLLDRSDRVLMLACVDPTREDAERFWITPGGGLKHGETHDTALRRELREELGVTEENLAEVGPWVWHRVITFRWLGRTLEQHERFRLLRVDRAERFTPQQLRELADKVAPTRLPDLLDDLLRSGPPAESIDVGV